MSNSILAIHPYDDHGTLVFDDAVHGLVKEALICGVPEILYACCRLAGIEDPKKGFTVLFSAEPFPGYHTKVIHDGEEVPGDPQSGNWYKVVSGGNIPMEAMQRTIIEGPVIGMRGWLCPALFHYFDEAPDFLYIQVKPRG